MTTSPEITEAVERLLFSTVDPTVEMDGRPLPAMSTMLYRVCDTDLVKFEEATRLIGLFIADALAAHDGGEGNG